MSHLSDVLRRAIAPLDPMDRDGRELAFARARESMIRLLSAYDPPLSAAQIEAKIDEFDAARRALSAELDAASLRQGQLRSAALAASGAPARVPSPPVGTDLARPSSRGGAPAHPEEIEPTAGPRPDTDDIDEAAWDEGGAQDDLYPEEGYEDYEPEAYDDGAFDDEAPFEDEADEPRPGGFGLGRLLLALCGLVLLLALVIGGLYLYNRIGPGVVTGMSEPAAIPPERIAESPALPDPVPVPAPAEASPAPVAEPPSPPAAAEPPISAGQAELPVGEPPALETLVLFDGHDPNAFESAPDNPVRFEGDTEGGFVEIASSTGSTGARMLIDQGVYERIAGKTIRIVVSARASREAPASTVRLAYQNGRALSPWSDLKLGDSYQPLSTVWSVPPERSGPARDVLLIEPGIPGDGTVVDIRSVRIDILS